jgi:hypothetical protein
MLITLFPLVEAPPSFLPGHPAEHGIISYVIVAAPPSHEGEIEGRYPRRNRQWESLYYQRKHGWQLLNLTVPLDSRKGAFMISPEKEKAMAGVYQCFRCPRHGTVVRGNGKYTTLNPKTETRMLNRRQSLGRKRLGKIPPDPSRYGFDFSEVFLFQRLANS